MSGSDLVAAARDLSARVGVQLVASPRLAEALTHPSASSRARPDNQRLEFLGDRVLGLVIAEALIARFPDEAEGGLAPRLNSLVRKETCADVAAEIGLGAHLRLGRSESIGGGRRKTAILGDAMEALIASIYLELGMQAARTAITRAWGARLDRVALTPRDPKTDLQEWAQARGEAPPSYPEVDRAGPDHAPIFTIAARVADGREERASASSKRAAQQAAAAALLARVEMEDDD